MSPPSRAADGTDNELIPARGHADIRLGHNGGVALDRSAPKENNMSTYALRTSRVPIHLAAAAAVLAGTVGAIVGAVIADDDDRPATRVEAAVTPRPDLASAPIYVEVVERARLREAVDHMPAGWPATEVMRQQIDAPLSATERARLSEAVDQMPAGWPATEIMRQQIEAPLVDAAEQARWREVAERMPAGWPATEATRRSGAEPSD